MKLNARLEFFRGRRVWAVTDAGEVRTYTIDFWEPTVCSIRDMQYKNLFRFLPPKCVFLTREEAVQHAVCLLRNEIVSRERSIEVFQKQLKDHKILLAKYEEELCNGNKVAQG